MHEPSVKILIVEDDEVLGALMQRHLNESGFIVVWVQTMGEAQDALEGTRHQAQTYDAVVLDIMLPDGDGLAFCRSIRRDLDVAVIMVTAKGETADRIRGLEIGADDYLPKPFSLWELEARIKAVLRRSYKREGNVSDRLVFGDLEIFSKERRVSLNGQAVELTRSEYDLLERLSKKPGIIYAREQLLDCIKGGETEAFDRAVDTHISNLRKKLEVGSNPNRYIKTVWGGWLQI